MGNLTYLWINLGCIFIPFIASFYPKFPFYKHWLSFFKANLLVAAFFIIWDMIFTDMGIWGFNPAYLSGMNLGNLPIEEVLFFICIPYACVFSFYALRVLVKNNPLKKMDKIISVGLIVLLAIGLVMGYQNWYTGTTFLLTIIFLAFLLYRKVDLSYHYLSYLFIIPFFYLSNGILTGSWIESPIVWYNNAENLAFRIGTIPAEDFIYGLLLIFLNIELFLYFEKRKLAKQPS